jgi:hypothetical protein
LDALSYFLNLRYDRWIINTLERVFAVQDREELETRLESLRLEHRDLDDAIDNLSATTGFDQLRLNRLKKRKLSLKDEILHMESDLLPNIIA